VFQKTRALIFGLALSVTAASAEAATSYTYGDVSTGPSGFLATSDPGGIGYGGIVVDFTATPFALNSVTTLSVDYQMTQGTFGGGSPRFTFFDTAGINSLGWVYFGTPLGGQSFSDPLAGAAGNTGNYADLTSSDVRVYVGNAGYTWSNFLSNFGNLQVGYVTLDVDGGFSTTQQGLFNNFTINDTVISASPVPGPVVGAGLPGLMMAFGGLIAWRRRRNQAAVA